MSSKGHGDFAHQALDVFRNASARQLQQFFTEEPKAKYGDGGKQNELKPCGKGGFEAHQDADDNGADAEEKYIKAARSRKLREEK